MKVLDLFAGEGGASAGYVAAGLDLLAAVDLDNNHMKKHRAYAYGLTLTATWEDGLEKYAADADLIHASPPCQRFSSATPSGSRDNHLDLIEPVRKALLATGKPFVIENVPRAPLEDPVWLDGSMFDLTVQWDIPKDKVKPLRRPTGWGTWQVVESRDEWAAGPVIDGPITFRLDRRRGFEVHGFTLSAPEVNDDIAKLPTMTIIEGTPTSFWDRWYAQIIPVEIKKQLMGTEWMTGKGVAEAIPPAYSEHIGREFIRQASTASAAAAGPDSA